VQFLRHASSEATDLSNIPRPGGGKKYTQRVVNEQKVFQPRESSGKGTKFSSTPLKATYEPSPIFGAVKPSSKEALKKPVSAPVKPRSKAKAKAKTEGPKKPLTADEKQVNYSMSF
jgi:hypothetical protein